jgi:hypothetical protein
MELQSQDCKYGRSFDSRTKKRTHLSSFVATILQLARLGFPLPRVFIFTGHLEVSWLSSRVRGDVMEIERPGCSCLLDELHRKRSEASLNSSTSAATAASRAKLPTCPFSTLSYTQAALFCL